MKNYNLYILLALSFVHLIPFITLLIDIGSFHIGNKEYVIIYNIFSWMFYVICLNYILYIDNHEENINKCYSWTFYILSFTSFIIKHCFGWYFIINFPSYSDISSKSITGVTISEFIIVIILLTLYISNYRKTSTNDNNDNNFTEML